MTDVIELKVSVNIFSGCFQLNGNAFYFHIPSTLPDSITLLVNREFARKANFRAKFLDKALTNISHMGIAQLLDLTKSGVSPLVGIGVAGNYIKQQLCGVKHRHIPRR